MRGERHERSRQRTRTRVADLPRWRSRSVLKRGLRRSRSVFLQLVQCVDDQAGRCRSRSALHVTRPRAGSQAAILLPPGSLAAMCVTLRRHPKLSRTRRRQYGHRTVRQIKRIAAVQRHELDRRAHLYIARNTTLPTPVRRARVAKARPLIALRRRGWPPSSRSPTSINSRSSRGRTRSSRGALRRTRDGRSRRGRRG